MISMDDYKKPDGKIDWSAFHKARVNAGEICSICHAFILRFASRSAAAAPQLCSDCKAMTETSEPVGHDKYIRCPKCAAHFDPYELEMYRCFRDGSHGVQCQACNHDFEIQTEVSYRFSSPALCP